MAIPVAVKAAVTVLTDKKLRRVVVGIVLGVIVIIFAPIAVLLGIVNAGQSIEWSDPNLQQSILDNMAEEEQQRLQLFADIMQAIEDEIAVQELSVEPLKAQVIFLCTLIDYEETETLYADFVSCFADDAEDDDIFNNIEDTFGVLLSAEERKNILYMCESKLNS